MREWIITSSVLLLVLILLRLVFHKRISAKLQYSLWALALVRLLLPFPLANTPISVMNFISQEQTVASTPLPDVQLTTTAEGRPVIFPAGVKSETLSPAELSPVGNSPTETKSFDVLTLLPHLWIAGSVATAAALLGSNLAFYRKLRSDRRRAEGIAADLPVYYSRSINSPCLFGRSIYLIPETLKSPEQLKHVLIHEQCHWQQRDPLWSLLRCVCLALWWWNPLVWAGAILSRRDCEAACDERVIAQLGEAERLNYGQTLVDMVAVRSKPGALLCTATTMTSHDMRERLLRIVQHKKVWRTAMATVLVLALICAGCTFTSADKKTEKPVSAEEQTATVTFQRLEDGLLLCLDGNETVYIDPGELLSDATLRALEEGDLLTVCYVAQSDEVPNPLIATDIRIDPVIGDENTVDPVAPSQPSQLDPEESAEASDTPAAESDSPAEDALTAPDDSEAVKEALKNHFNAEGSTGRMRRQALTSFYDNAAQVSLSALFYNGTALTTASQEDVTELEWNALRKLADYSEYWEQSDAVWLTPFDMDLTLQNYFGIGLAQTALIGMEQFEYLPEFDRYYLFHSDTNARLPIEVIDVLQDEDHYYYMTYRFSDSPDEPEHLCCLYRDSEGWKIVYNLEDADGMISGAEAVKAVQNREPLQYTSLRPAYTDALSYAINNVLLDFARAQMPQYAEFVTEAHDVLHIKWQEDLLCVSAVSLYQVYTMEEDGLFELDSGIKPVQIWFGRSKSGDQLCYRLADVQFAEDPENPDSLFPNEDWANAAGLTLDDLKEDLAAECDHEAQTMPAEENWNSEAFLAAMSAGEAPQAAANVVDYCGKQRHILRYQQLGAEERQRQTNLLIEDLKENGLAEAFGWDDEYLEKNVKFVQVAFSVEYNPYFDDSLESGVYQQEFHVCRDPETLLWRVFNIGDRVKLVDYNTND